jgi:hypothetical protein
MALATEIRATDRSTAVHDQRTSDKITKFTFSECDESTYVVLPMVVVEILVGPRTTRLAACPRL